jgi:hypothetical protein
MEWGVKNDVTTHRVYIDLRVSNKIVYEEQPVTFTIERIAGKLGARGPKLMG